MQTRYVYATGYKSQMSAEMALIDMIEEGEISESERPEIKSYHIYLEPRDRVVRWLITLAH